MKSTKIPDRVTVRAALARLAYPEKPPVLALTLDNQDGNGVRDYTAAVARDVPIRIHRTLNAAAKLEFALDVRDPALIVPPAGAKVRLARADGSPLFAGSLEAEPAYEFLGWNISAPVYRLRLRACSDDRLLDARGAPRPRACSGIPAGEALAQITRDVAAETFDVSGIQPLDALYGFESTRRKSWSEHAGAIARQSRAVVRVEDGKVVLEAAGARTHSICESDASFVPSALKLAAMPPLATDVTVVGETEPAAYVKEYLAADGAGSAFPLSRAPLTHPRKPLFDEGFGAAALDPRKWNVSDPASALSSGAGLLRIDGGTGADGGTTAALLGRVELGGALVFDHGAVEFSGDADGILGGLYRETIAAGGCLAGFAVRTDGGNVTIGAWRDGAAAGATLAVQPGHAYALRTRLYCAEHRRAEQVWHSSAHPAGSPAGGAAPDAALRVVLEAGEIDPAHAAATSWTTLLDEVLAAAPAFATYALVNVTSMHAHLGAMRIATAPEIEVRCAPPGETAKTIALAGVADGGAAQLVPGAVVEFHRASIPAAQSQIEARYRTARTALARVVDVNAAPDRAMVCRVVSPKPASSADCGRAAEALLDDATQARHAGEYAAPGDAFAGDVLPGDAVEVDVPSRGATFSAIVRETWIEASDPGDGCGRVRLRFANDAAEPIAIETARALREPGEIAARTRGAAADSIAAASAAEITTIGADIVAIDAGMDAPEGGGFEVRSADEGWGSDSAGLVGRFGAREFVIDSDSASADFCLRAYDGSTPPRYSAATTILHLERAS